MIDPTFATAVPVFVGIGHVRSIASVPQALACLSDWPGHRRDHLHAKAIEACRAALAGTKTSETAQRAFQAFARSAGLAAPRV